jgi:hypothetical protein
MYLRPHFDFFLGFLFQIPKFPFFPVIQ